MRDVSQTRHSKKQSSLIGGDPILLVGGETPVPHSSLRATVIKLAAQRADLRAHLLPLLGQPVGGPAPQGVAPATLPPGIVIQMAPPVAPQLAPPPPPPAPVAPPPIVVPQPAMYPMYPMPMPMVPMVAPVAAPVAPVAIPATQYIPPVSTPTTNPTVPGTPVDSGFTTARTQRGFEADMAPEMQRMLSLDMSRDQVAEWAKIRLRDGFKQKDQLYLILIRHQSTFEGDDQFRLSIERCIDIWRTQGNEHSENLPGDLTNHFGR